MGGIDKLEAIFTGLAKNKENTHMKDVGWLDFPAPKKNIGSTLSPNCSHSKSLAQISQQPYMVGRVCAVEVVHMVNALFVPRVVLRCCLHEFLEILEELVAQQVVLW